MATTTIADVLTALDDLSGRTTLMTLKGRLREAGAQDNEISGALEAAREGGFIEMDWLGDITRREQAAR